MTPKPMKRRVLFCVRQARDSLNPRPCSQEAGDFAGSICVDFERCKSQANGLQPKAHRSADDMWTKHEHPRLDLLRRRLLIIIQTQKKEQDHTQQEPQCVLQLDELFEDVVLGTK